MAHTAIAEFPCNPGKGKELLELLAGALVDTRAFEGCESIETYTSQDEPDRVVLWEKWATRANYDAYLAWRIEGGMMDMLVPFMDPESLRIVNLDAQTA